MEIFRWLLTFIGTFTMIVSIVFSVRSVMRDPDNFKDAVRAIFLAICAVIILTMMASFVGQLTISPLVDMVLTIISGVLVAALAGGVYFIYHEAQNEKTVIKSGINRKQQIRRALDQIENQVEAVPLNYAAEFTILYEQARTLFKQYRKLDDHATQKLLVTTRMLDKLSTILPDSEILSRDQVSINDAFAHIHASLTKTGRSLIDEQIDRMRIELEVISLNLR